jgi:glutamate-1-semialdehyde 2,1-aminomutase
MIFLNSNLSKQPEIVSSNKQWLIKRNGAKLFDTWLGAGTLLFGHNNEPEQIRIDLLPQGIELDQEFIHLLNLLVDFKIGAIGFQTSGSSAISRAVRLARAATGKNMIAVVGKFWHGSEDEFLFIRDYEQISKGIPKSKQKDVYWFPDPKKLAEFHLLDDLAAVLLEPHQGSDPSISLFEEMGTELRERLKSSNVLVIADEIITGFRERYGSCTKSRKYNPDIVVFGKTCGLGYPIGMVIANTQVLEGGKYPPFWGGTFAASPSQLVILRESLAKLAILDYSLIRNNHAYLVQRIKDLISSFEYDINSGCGFSRLRKRGSANTAREFITKDQDFLNLQEKIQNNGIYVANNALIFPSIYHIGKH